MKQNTTDYGPEVCEWSEELRPFADRIQEAFPAVHPSVAFQQALKGQLLRVAERDRLFMTAEPLSTLGPFLWSLAGFLLLGLFLYRRLGRGGVNQARTDREMATTS